MTNRAGSIVTWSSYNYPTDVSASDATGAEDVQLSYGPDRQRWKQIYTAPGVTENTYYIGGLMDKVFSGGTTDYRHYIYAGKEPVAVYSRTSGSVNTMSYMLEDHQGGVANIASKSGTTDVNESFSAFGTRRNPTSWSGAPSTGDLNTIAGLSRQGYTFQTWLGQSMGLNHMNGRVEDAILGRFLSPDPHVPDPSSAQSYNRYSYVTNNPMSYTDPSGFCGSNIREISAAVDFGCGGGGVTIPMGSVEGLIGTSDDGFGNLDGSGITQPFKPSNQNSNVSNQGNNPSAESRTPPTPSGPPPAAQSPDPAQSQGCGDCRGTNNAFNDPNAFDLNSGPIVDTSRGPGNQLAQGAGSALDGNFLSVAAFAEMASEVAGGLSTVASLVESTVSSAAELAHSFGLFGLAFGTGADFISLQNNGISLTQFNVNLGVGAAGLAGGALTVLPSAQYFIATWGYNHFYPGGSQQAWQVLGSALNDMASNGLGP